MKIEFVVEVVVLPVLLFVLRQPLDHGPYLTHKWEILSIIIEGKKERRIMHSLDIVDPLELLPWNHLMEIRRLLLLFGCHMQQLLFKLLLNI